MPSWQNMLAELSGIRHPVDELRRKYLHALSALRDRNVIAYYSGWLNKKPAGDLSIADEDMTGFMNAVHTCDRRKGLDLILHTPGGNLSATDAIVRYLGKSFHGDIECFVPQLAMSAGTMIACACNKIYMGEHSSLGPIDPQFNGISAHGVLEEFKNAIREVSDNPRTLPIYQAVIGKYPPAFLGECRKAIALADEHVGRWLRAGMFRDLNDAAARAIIDNILAKLNNHDETKQHDRHLGIDFMKGIGLKVFRLEDDSVLQDAVLSVHHAFTMTFSQTSAAKIIESASGACFVRTQKV